METTAPAATHEAGRHGWLTQRRIEALLGLLFVSPYILHFIILQAGAMLFSLVLSFFETDLLTGRRFCHLSKSSLTA